MKHIRYGVMVNIGRSHRPARGSIPRTEAQVLFFSKSFLPFYSPPSLLPHFTYVL